MTGIWRTLGIARTTDIAAIRRAYAQALRAMDPDADPQAFADLRTARDQALASARDAGPAPAQSDVGERAEPPAISPLGAEALSAPLLDANCAGSVDASGIEAPARPLADARPDRGAGVSVGAADLSLAVPLVESVRGDVAILRHTTTAPYDAAYSELVGLLHGEDQPDAERLTELVRFLLDDPRMARLAFAEDAERWFAGVLAGTIPRSDPLLALAAERFGWSDEVGTLGLSDEAERVAERARAMTYWHAAAAPSHPDHRLFAELTRPDDVAAPWRNRLIRRKTMRDYLARVRRSYPDVEGWFEPARLGDWDRPRVGGPGWSAWGIGLFVLFKVLVVIFGSTNHDRSAPPVVVAPVPTIVASYPSDANLALLTFADGLTLERTEREDPKLADAIEERWRAALTARLPVESFIRETGAYLRERFTGSVLRAPYEAIARLRRLDLAELDAARALGADPCARYLAGELPIDRVRSRVDEQRRHRVMAEILLADPRDTRRKDGATFMVPSAVMQQVAERSGLDREALGAALDRRGPARAQCDARRALLSIALALEPKTGLPLLRAM